jgi:cellulose synthase/poly-beta-1,6-N-acetylglucosamine synthase-like glycosyltransferase
LQNLASLDYPPERLELILVSDGSSDSTPHILTEAAKQDRCRSVVFEDRRGKASRLNDALAVATGEIVLFVDARQDIERDALRLLMENFVEESVGCASGELMLGDSATGEAAQGMGVYWRVEKKIREWESASGSVVGATGALYAVRRSLLVPVPEDTILDDVFLPLHAAQKGARVVFDDRARAWDSPDLGSRREFRRKVRTLTGNYQLLQLAPWLLSGKNPLRFRFISHKLMRLAVPFALAVMLGSSLAAPGVFYHAAFLAQLFFYALALLTFSRVQRGPLAWMGDAVLTLIVLNTAAVVACAHFFTGRKEVWVR